MGGVYLMATELSLIVVEDNELLREEMVSFLSRPGWQAHGVDCGEELNHWLQQHTPHIAVLDVNLPGESGLSYAARLRAGRPDIGIVVLTVRTGSEIRTRSYDSGADLYLQKPCESAEIIAALRSMSRRIARPAAKPALCLYPSRLQVTGPAGDVAVLPWSAFRAFAWNGGRTSLDRSARADGARLEVQCNGAIPGTQYDQLRLTNAASNVTLGGALDLVLAVALLVLLAGATWAFVVTCDLAPGVGVRGIDAPVGFAGRSRRG